MARTTESSFQFFDEPKRPSGYLEYKIWRAPKGGCSVICLSHRPKIVYTHFAGQRTLPCLGEEVCQRCEDERAREKHVVAVCDSSLAVVSILEMTRRSWPAIKRAIDEFESLRGCTIRIKRTNGKKNGPLYVEVDPPPRQKMALPTCPDVEEFLCNMYEARKLRSASEPPITPEQASERPRARRAGPSRPKPIAVGEILANGRVDLRGEVS